MESREIKPNLENQLLPLQKKADVAITSTVWPDYVSARILEIELGEPLPSLSALDEKTGSRYQIARCLIRLHTCPLGMVELQLVDEKKSPDEYIGYIWHALEEQINEHLSQDGLPQVTELGPEGLCSTSLPRCLEERDQFLASAPLASIVVATHNRPDQICRCLDSLLALHYPRYEIIVVDNAPTSTATADVIREIYRNVPQVHYTCEERAGASLARNRGIIAAQGDIIAFTDDDVVVDPYWLLGLVRAFSLAENVACVTGLLLPLEMETQEQCWLEEYGGYSKGYHRRIFDMQENHPKLPLHPYAAGQFGTGANMAFTAAFLRSIAGFDPALGPGRPSCGGEDLSLFFQAVIQGYKLIYEPASIAYHPHHRGYASLRKQIHSYGVGLTAYLTKNLIDNPGLLFDFLKKVPYGLYFALSNRSSKNRKKSERYPKELTRLEIAGMLSGPFAYLRSRWTMRDRRKLSVYPVAYRSAYEKGHRDSENVASTSQS